MNLDQLIDQNLRDLVTVSLPGFRVELILCATIVALLFVRMLVPRWSWGPQGVTLAGAVLAAWAAFWPPILPEPAFLFGGVLVQDDFAVYCRALLALFLLLFAVFTWISGIPGLGSATEFYVLSLAALLGMCLMVSANHAVIVVLGLEMAGVPGYAMAGLLKHRRESSEAALKFAVFGAGTAGIMLYGISLIGGLLGSVHLPTMASRLAADLPQILAEQPAAAAVMSLGALMFLVGLAFKLSAVPFQFWTPDVFEGAAAEVGAFLSVASKTAALALLLRVTLLFTAPPSATVQAVDAPAVAASAPAVFSTISTPNSLTDSLGTPPATEAVRNFFVALLTVLAALTCTFGNWAAYGQQNLKRLMAYSTIGHAGYLIMPVAAAVALSGPTPEAAKAAVASALFYLVIYLFMNLGAFALTAFVRNTLSSEQIDSCAGLIRYQPLVAVCGTIIFFSLLGLPPLAGFMAKFSIFAALARAELWGLLAIAVFNTVLSLFYYLRVIKVMTLDPVTADSLPRQNLSNGAKLFLLAITVPLIVFGIWWNELFLIAEKAASAVVLPWGAYSGLTTRIGL